MRPFSCYILTLVCLRGQKELVTWQSDLWWNRAVQGLQGHVTAWGGWVVSRGAIIVKTPRRFWGWGAKRFGLVGWAWLHGVSHSPEYGQQTINWGKLLGKIMSPDKVKDESFFITFNVALKWSEVSLISAFLYVDNFSPWMTINVLLYPCN